MYFFVYLEYHLSQANILTLNNKHKALTITLLIAGTIILFVFNLNLRQHTKFANESYYELEPEKELTEQEKKLLETLERLNNSKPETNNAFNETKKSKQFAKAYKVIAPPQDYVPKQTNSTKHQLEERKDHETPIESKLNEATLAKYSKVKDLLEQQKSGGNNSKSSISFSLKNRDKIHIPIPIYLCEKDGKIVINITVNAKGDVTDAYPNTTSTSQNKCLIDHALDYAKQSRFSTDTSKDSQIGSITFYFVGK